MYASHNYLGRIYAGHKYIGRNCAGHNYIGRNYADRDYLDRNLAGHEHLVASTAVEHVSAPTVAAAAIELVDKRARSDRTVFFVVLHFCFIQAIISILIFCVFAITIKAMTTSAITT